MNKPIIDFRLPFDPCQEHIERNLMAVSQTAGKPVKLSDCTKLKRELDNYARREDTYQYDTTR